MMQLFIVKQYLMHFSLFKDTVHRGMEQQHIDISLTSLLVHFIIV